MAHVEPFPKGEKVYLDDVSDEELKEIYKFLDTGINAVLNNIAICVRTIANAREPGRLEAFKKVSDDLFEEAASYIEEDKYFGK